MDKGAERGSASLAQTVIVAPTLLLVLMGIVQAGLVLHARNVAEQAAQEGLASARAYDGSESAAQTAAQDFLQVLGDRTLRSREVQASRSATTARVTVSGTVVTLVPWIDLSVHEAAVGPVERFVSESP